MTLVTRRAVWAIQPPTCRVHCGCARSAARAYCSRWSRVVRICRVFAAELESRLAGLRRVLRAEGVTLEASARSFALIRELSDRVLGKRHYDCQMLAGWAMLKGMVAEMETGEGKTLAVGLCCGHGRVGRHSGARALRSTTTWPIVMPRLFSRCTGPSVKRRRGDRGPGAGRTPRGLCL